MKEQNLTILNMLVDNATIVLNIVLVNFHKVVSKRLRRYFKNFLFGYEIKNNKHLNYHVL